MTRVRVNLYDKRQGKPGSTVTRTITIEGTEESILKEVYKRNRRLRSTSSYWHFADISWQKKYYNFIDKSNINNLEE